MASIRALTATSQLRMSFKRVEDPEDVHPGLGGVAHEPVGEIVGVVPVSHQVLAPEQHHGGGLLQDPLDGADPLPGVVPQKTVGGVEGGAPQTSMAK